MILVSSINYEGSATKQNHRQDFEIFLFCSRFQDFNRDFKILIRFQDFNQDFRILIRFQDFKRDFTRFHANSFTDLHIFVEKCIVLIVNSNVLAPWIIKSKFSIDKFFYFSNAILWCFCCIHITYDIQLIIFCCQQTLNNVIWEPLLH